MYEEFAAVYDLFMDDFDYAAWAGYYIELLQKAGWRGGEICECGCGTGSLSVELLRRGIPMICSDISDDMLRAASQKAMRRGVRARFIHQDMREIALPHRVSAVICACDGVNYLTELDDVRRFFESAAHALKPGGVLAFDISSPNKFEHILADGLFGEDRDEATYIWRNRWDGAKRLMDMELTFFVRQGDGLYRRFDEYQTQRSHTVAELKSLLCETGYTDTAVYADQSFNEPDGSEQRLHFSAVYGGG